jgi:hypothetical protein
MPIFVRQLSLAVCDVCRLLDSDVRPKPCDYCRLCDSWICQEDLNSWIRRARAFVRHRLEPSFKGDPNYKTGDVAIDKEAGLDG